MNTTINKALVAVLSGIATIVGVIWGEDLVAFATPDLVAAVGAVITTALVYLIPNADPATTNTTTTTPTNTTGQ
jgi:hypothetical protein